LRMTGRRKVSFAKGLIEGGKRQENIMKTLFSETRNRKRQGERKRGITELEGGTKNTKRVPSTSVG